MSEEADEENKQAPENTGNSSHTGLLILVLCVVVSAIGVTLFLMKNGKSNNAQKPKDGQVGKGNLVNHQEYMIYIKKIEVSPTKSDGDSWDPRDSAPDVFYEVFWKNNKIYKSDARKDSLIATWIPVGLSLKETILSGGVSVDQAVNIPIIKRDRENESSDKIIFKIYDDDTFRNDLIETIPVYISKLDVGDNVFDYKNRQGFGVVKMVIRVIDNSLSTNEKVEQLMGGE